MIKMVHHQHCASRRGSECNCECDPTAALPPPRKVQQTGSPNIGFAPVGPNQHIISSFQSSPRPTSNNADEWHVWLEENRESGNTYLAVQIAEAMDDLAARSALLDRMQQVRLLLIGEGQAVCVGGRYDGWRMFKNVDGQWVTAHKLTEEIPSTKHLYPSINKNLERSTAAELGILAGIANNKVVASEAGDWLREILVEMAMREPPLIDVDGDYVVLTDAGASKLAEGGLPTPGQLKARGVSRDAGEPRTLCIAFNRVPSDDELRAVHNFLIRSPGRCPFCNTPSYALPCTQCGEPDIPEDAP